MKRLILSFLALIFLLSACTVLDRTSTIYYNESELSLADVTQMRQEFPEETEKTVNLIPCGEDDIENAVYWTKSGNVWHLQSDCGYVKNGSDLFYGSESDALSFGKERVCTSCSKK